MIKVAAAVIVSDGKILAAKRKNERLGGGFWEFPGGKLEPGETPKQACQREVAEELGDQCEVLERIEVSRHFTTPYGELEIDFFWTKLKTYNLKLVAASEYRWLTPEQLASVTWLKPSEPVLEVIKQTDLRKFE
ncbi:(deoxy)nucleoside triphosphate pyrophosphohydrolase [Ligilactobacillus murinus]|jgi:mutator protein MutT|uniref:8-oxo-dGTP diphosphatase n=1 Tax=Ligilactobacillus murinus TaxID=1622 RepID=A0A2Z4VZ83_9LACO|nr:(deoxy)nucleoside triphosphate pyrophosphohydrolase [Ligilactobacillus murinus]MDE7023532.1 (deoxy)nucleoside triphosphate pyrophosphohydrolase [Ligilactobacillus sp.]NBH85331.1 (deoxy)nucleoside triphosphate pyrophosphohydrolase [Lachnospiraceae bacterium]HAB50291.1 (deoxy)nucleoside triphosphate pyrophosphohydrolase [Lactobacillus sp.]AWZ38605.1 (deoxy)nucleoside triphosphate pyrophosphohydrolase [Ligilactobacillus murinus]AWZ40400.1 (deoxy)nucleoside triphosphate pyrophosphohydrolase [Li